MCECASSHNNRNEAQAYDFPFLIKFSVFNFVIIIQVCLLQDIVKTTKITRSKLAITCSNN